MVEIERRPGEASEAARYMNEHDAAKYIGMSPGWLRNSRIRGAKVDAPPFYKIGAAVRYRVSDLDAWLESRVRIAGAAA